VTIPEKYAGRRIFLWFGGVDEKAQVYLNGKELGISHSSTYVPFEFDATPVVVAGGDNVVAVSVVNRLLDELGTGGIVSPVMFYAPAAGKDAKVENAVELGSTFP
jgi:hypothetical protein